MKEKELKAALNRIEISDDAQKRILSRCINKEKERCYMRSKKKLIVIAAAVVLVLGTTVFAASGIISSWNGSSHSRPDYTKLPSYEECMSAAGYAPVLIEEFSNGYAFEDGNIVNNDLTDDAGNSVEKFKSFTFRYQKDGDKVVFSQEKFNSQIGFSGAVAAAENGVEIYYISYTNKLVPPDYELTEEDKRAQESGELVFSYGSAEVKIQQVRSVSWKEDGMHSSLMQIDGELSQEDLVLMAKEAIAAR